MIEKSGSAKWGGSLQGGHGMISTQSGVLREQPYGFASRFEGGGDTNPEELIGAAHAACYSMALSMILGQHDLTPDEVATKATVTLSEVDGGFAVTKVHLDVSAKIPGATEAQFEEATRTAKDNCPISKLLNAEITMDATMS